MINIDRELVGDMDKREWTTDEAQVLHKRGDHGLVIEIAVT